MNGRTGSRRMSVVLASILASSLTSITVLAACADTPASTRTSASMDPVESIASSGGASSSVPPRQLRVLLIGDSTLLAVRRYGAFRALGGFQYVFDAESCRTLGIPSCGDAPIPPNSVEAIIAAEGQFDIVVIMAGYDEWWTSFPQSFDEVVSASRSKGASRIIWLNYREGVGYTAPDGATANEAFVTNNRTLRAKVASGENRDVELADWFGYTEVERGWLAEDGIHLTETGALAVADYISRTVAHLEGLPCPAPWEPGGPIDDPCPAPDDHDPVGDVHELYPEDG
jgi:hypothetical protein